MFELFDTNPAIDVQEAEYQRLLGYPRDFVPEGRSQDLADWAREWYSKNGRPWVYAWQSDGLELANERLRLRGMEFSSRHLYDQLQAAKSHNAVLVAVSAGKECEERARQAWSEGKPDEYFFMEMYGSAVVEHLITTTSGRICDWAEQNAMTVLPHYSPGYSGWDVADQVKLWEVMRGQSKHDFNGHLHVMETGMLRPKKSLLALFGLTRHVELARSLAKLVPCENCALLKCQYRRSPYKHALPQIEDVRTLQTSECGDLSLNIMKLSGLNHNAKYSIKERALEKWSQERLQIRALHDGSVEARFRYEGTTCSNMGRTLEYDYHIKLGPPETGYRVTSTECVPAAGDTGHQFQCEYLNNEEDFLESIRTEKPLLGKPLNDVLSWQRPYSPSGCYCDADRRTHKWGLVFEVIHFALVQQERGLTKDGQTAAVQG